MENVSVASSRKVRLKVLTPLRVVHDKPVEMIIARTSEGDIGILYGHDNRSALLGDGVLCIYEQGRKKEEVLMILGGIMSVENNEVVILSEVAEHPDKIQEFLEKQAAEKVASEVEDEDADLYTKRMEVAIRNALVRLNGAYPMLENVQNEREEK